MAARRVRLPPATAGADPARGSIRFIGTATVLIRYAGFTILTDPNFLHRGESVRLGYGLRSRRLTDPAVEIDALPPLDFVLLSQLRDDHWDRVAQAHFPCALPVVTTPDAAQKLADHGFADTHPLATWDTVEYERDDARLRVTAMPGGGGPRLLSRLLPPVMGSLLEWQTADGRHLLRIYITGDTLVHDGIREIRARYSEVDIALLHLGGTRVLGVLVTMDARQGVEMMRIIDPRTAIPIHYNDYTVFTSPLAAFDSAVKAAHLSDRVAFVRHGELFGFDVPRARMTRSA